MKLAIMQPYFLPYIGYWQLMAAVDTFVVYDNIKYTKKGWINRNRMLRDGTDVLFSLPLKSASDALDIDERELADTYDRSDLLNRFRQAYRKAEQFDAMFPLLEHIVGEPTSNLFDYLFRSISIVHSHLGLSSELKASSTLNLDHRSLRGQDKVLAICEHLGADTYVNAIGGTELYAASEFAARGIDLRFLKSDETRYQQFGDEFVPWLSIVDVLMFNPPDVVKHLINGYSLQ